MLSSSVYATNSTPVASGSVLERPSVDYGDPVERARVRVLIADNHPLIIAGIRRTIDGIDDIEVVGEAGSGSELLQLVERRAPGVVLMDLRMPGVIGVACIEEVRRRWPEVKVVVLSACDDRPSIDAALRAGASAYILKSARALDIASVLRQTSSGVVFDASSLLAGCVRPVDDPALPNLSGRERSVLAAVASGLTSEAVARDLWVSQHTVKFHLTNIYRKLGVSNRASAVRYALEHDLIMKEAAHAQPLISV
jgi:DNA-binding NarL/FixJ family response regulator